MGSGGLSPWTTREVPVISSMSSISSFLEHLRVRRWMGLAFRVPGLRWKQGTQRPAVVVGCVLDSLSLHFDLPSPPLLPLSPIYIFTF